jgi:hypothetical protein
MKMSEWVKSRPDDRRRNQSSAEIAPAVSPGLLPLGNMVLACLILLGFLFGAFSTFESWKAFGANSVWPNEQERHDRSAWWR